MNLNQWSEKCSKWREGCGFQTSWENIPTKLMLVVTELSEAMEAYRDDDHIHFNEEIADTFIRLFDICGALEMDIDAEVEKKMRVNMMRPHIHGRKFDDRGFEDEPQQVDVTAREQYKDVGTHKDTGIDKDRDTNGCIRPTLGESMDGFMRKALEEIESQKILNVPFVGEDTHATETPHREQPYTGD